MKHNNAQDEEIYSKSKNCTSFNKDHISQQKKILETINDITAENNTTLKSNHEYSNHEIESNLELQNSTEVIRVSSEKEVYSKSKDKFLIKDEFNQEKRILNIDDNVENHKLLNLNSHLNNEEHIRLDSTELNVSPAKLLLSECNVIPPKTENNSFEQDYKIKSENIDSCDENKDQRNNSCTTLDDNFLSESVTKLNRMTEPRNESLKLLHRFTYQGLPNVQRKTISSCKIQENIEAANSKDATCSITEKNGPDKETCTVISTIPKCQHLDAIREDGALNNTTKRVIMESVELREKHQNYQSEESSNARIAKRTRVVRSQSKSDDFETDTLKKQRRYLTLPPENIAHALNLNFPARNSISSDTTEKNREQIVKEHCTDRAKNTDIDKGESYGLITGACCCIN